MKTRSKTGSLVFVGCMFIGMGIGSCFGFENIGMGTIIGMGVGFIAQAIISHNQTNESENKTKQA